MGHLLCAGHCPKGQGEKKKEDKILVLKNLAVSGWWGQAWKRMCGTHLPVLGTVCSRASGSVWEGWVPRKGIDDPQMSPAQISRKKLEKVMGEREAAGKPLWMTAGSLRNNEGGEGQPGGWKEMALGIRQRYRGMSTSPCKQVNFINTTANFQIRKPWTKWDKKGHLELEVFRMFWLDQFTEKN